MFFREILDFDENFKFLDRLNSLVFNVWKDDNAKTFKNQSMEQLEMFYRNYINEMRQKCNEMKALEREINEALNELSKIPYETMMLTNNPAIQGCLLCYAEGKIDKYMSGTESFIITSDETTEDIEAIACTRCEKLYEIEHASINAPL